MTATATSATRAASPSKPLHASQVQPYLFFEGRCEEAIEFYKGAVGAQANTLLRYKDSPEKSMCEGISEEKVMHASFRVGSTDILASDGRCTGNPKFDGFALSLTVATPAGADAAFNALNDGGEVVMPLAKTFFSDRFGMLKDKFGVMWMVYVEPTSR